MSFARLSPLVFATTIAAAISSSKLDLCSNDLPAFTSQCDFRTGQGNCSVKGFLQHPSLATSSKTCHVPHSQLPNGYFPVPCAYQCGIDPACKSYSYGGKPGECVFYNQTLVDMGFRSGVGKEARTFYDVTCYLMGCSQVIFNSGFEQANQFGAPYEWQVTPSNIPGGCTTHMNGLAPYTGRHSLRCTGGKQQGLSSITIAQSIQAPISNNLTISFDLGYSAPPNASTDINTPVVHVFYNGTAAPDYFIYPCSTQVAADHPHACIFDGKAHYKKVTTAIPAAEENVAASLSFEIDWEYTPIGWNVLLDDINIPYPYYFGM